ncbi:hypothetical protein C1645_837011 [Glomus cerebriforme]|uniref:Uncharacterized protein n=1 Tax=Glomus cerebriforme TaxID=658196 RepID=A0A397S7I2_9GLOM|nr:hypothetical protein C1645_837011 [Glomus cerebriforme]
MPDMPGAESPFEVFRIESHSSLEGGEVLGNINYGEWLDKPEELLESMLKVWKSPKYDAYIKKGKLINEGSYVCEVLVPLLNIVMSDLPENPIA